jgi:hypothetical protein
MTAVGCAGMSIVYSGTPFVHCTLSNANFINNSALSSYRGAGAVVRVSILGFALTEVVFQGNSGHDIGGVDEMPTADDNRFLLRDCYFDKTPLSSYIQSDAVYEVELSNPTIDVPANNPALCVLLASPAATAPPQTVTSTPSYRFSRSAQFRGTANFPVSPQIEFTGQLYPSSFFIPTDHFSLSPHDQVTEKFTQSSPLLPTVRFSSSDPPFPNSYEFNPSSIFFFSGPFHHSAQFSNSHPYSHSSTCRSSISLVSSASFPATVLFPLSGPFLHSRLFGISPSFIDSNPSIPFFSRLTSSVTRKFVFSVNSPPIGSFYDPLTSLESSSSSSLSAIVDLSRSSGRYSSVSGSAQIARSIAIISSAFSVNFITPIESSIQMTTDPPHGRTPSQGSFITAMAVSVIAVLVIAAIVLVAVWRIKHQDESEEDGRNAAEMDEWIDFVPTSLSVTEFIECENILATETQLHTFANETMDETGFLNLT